MALAVADDGSVLIDSDTLAPSSTLVIASLEGVTPVTQLPGWYSIPGSAISLPSGGFASEMLQTAGAEDGQTVDVVRIAAGGSTRILSGPWAPRPGKFQRLGGVTA